MFTTKQYKKAQESILRDVDFLNSECVPGSEGKPVPLGKYLIDHRLRELDDMKIQFEMQGQIEAARVQKERLNALEAKKAEEHETTVFNEWGHKITIPNEALK